MRRRKGNFATDYPLSAEFLTALGIERNPIEGIFQHPLLKKVINVGNISKKCKTSKTIGEDLQQILSNVRTRKNYEKTEVDKIEYIITTFINCVIGEILKSVGDTDSGIRNIHSPGSVAISEARNLYYGERLDSKALYDLALRLCNSIAVGNSIGIYTENKSTMDELKRIIINKFSSLVINPKDLMVNKYEEDKPYVTFTKFILWLKENVSDFKKQLEQQIRSSAFTIFLMPEDKARWSVLEIPRLDTFISEWVNKEKNRQKLSNFYKEINNVVARISKPDDNIMEILTNYEELLSEKLLHYGIIDYYALKNIQNIIIDISYKYDIRGPLWKNLLIV